MGGKYAVEYIYYAVRLWLRHYATNWKVAGSISDEVIFKFT
jgi:hypothetical protein